jgi:hypothetical protein
VVVRTLLQVDTEMRRLNPSQKGRGHIDVSYRLVDALGMWLPATMDETFEASRGYAWDQVTGHADYSNYRRFETSGRIKK